MWAVNFKHKNKEKPWGYPQKKSVWQFEDRSIKIFTESLGKEYFYGRGAWEIYDTKIQETSFLPE